MRARVKPRRQMALLLAPLLALALLVVACPGGDTGGEHPLTLTLKFDPFGLVGCLNCANLDNCALDCGGVAGIFLVDAESKSVLDEACVALPGRPGDTLRLLPAFIKDATLVNNIPIGRSVVVEIAVFSPSPFAPATGVDAGPTPICKRPIPGPSGIPVTDDSDMHYPSFWGRSDPLTLRSGDNPVTVKINCVSDRPACAPRPDALFKAQVIDMETQLPNPHQPRDLDVRFGHLVRDGMGAVGFEALDLLVLPDTPPQEPEWSKFVRNGFYDPTCLATRVIRLDAQTGYNVVSCDGTAVPGSANMMSLVTTTGYTIDKDFVDVLLPKLGLLKVPDHGMIIGKVVDPAGNAVTDAVVAPLAGMAKVIYLDDANEPSATLGATSPSGWFVVDDRPQLPSLEAADDENCCQIFSATRAADVGCSQGPVGTVNAMVMAARIVIDPAHPTCMSSP